MGFSFSTGVPPTILDRPLIIRWKIFKTCLISTQNLGVMIQFGDFSTAQPPPSHGGYWIEKNWMNLRFYLFKNMSLRNKQTKKRFAIFVWKLFDGLMYMMWGFAPTSSKWVYTPYKWPKINKWVSLPFFSSQISLEGSNLDVASLEVF